MTKRDIAGYLEIDVKTLYNWEKDKPNLFKTVMKGLAFDEIINNQKKNLSELETIQADASGGKFKLK